MPLFQDQMDPTRIVKPLRQEGRNTICGVYFKDKTGRLNYAGTAPVPTSLFEETNPWSKRVGFVVRGS